MTVYDQAAGTVPLSLDRIDRGIGAPSGLFSRHHYRVPPIAPRGTIAEPKNVLQRCQTQIFQSKPFYQTIDDVLAEFSHGTNPKVVGLANKLVEGVTDHTSDPEVTLDVDGALAFDLRLTNGDLMFGELNADGSLSVTVLDDRSKDIVVKKYYSSATATQFLELL